MNRKDRNTTKREFVEQPFRKRIKLTRDMLDCTDEEAKCIMEAYENGEIDVFLEDEVSDHDEVSNNIVECKTEKYSNLNQHKSWLHDLSSSQSSKSASINYHDDIHALVANESILDIKPQSYQSFSHFKENYPQKIPGATKEHTQTNKIIREKLPIGRPSLCGVDGKDPTDNVYTTSESFLVQEHFPVFRSSHEDTIDSQYDIFSDVIPTKPKARERKQPKPVNKPVREKLPIGRPPLCDAEGKFPQNDVHTTSKECNPTVRQYLQPNVDEQRNPYNLNFVQMLAKRAQRNGQNVKLTKVPEQVSKHLLNTK